MTATARLRAAWRRLCPDITTAEIDALTAIGMAGTSAEVALRAYRAGLAAAHPIHPGDIAAWLPATDELVCAPCADQVEQALPPVLPPVAS